MPMARPLRLEFAGALYHVTSRGDRGEAVYRLDEDRELWFEVFSQVCERFNWVVHGYCQMTNHYHLLVETPDGNLSRGMRQLNGVYTQKFNRKHQENGHLFQGRYKAILVQKDNYLLELTRYVVLNPVRAGMVNSPEEWAWSSYNAMLQQQTGIQCLDVEWTLSQFGKYRKPAIKKYKQFVIEGIGSTDPKQALKNQIYLGDEAFIQLHRQSLEKVEKLREVSKAQKKAATLTLKEYQTRNNNRNEAMAKAYLTGAYSMSEIGKHFGVHYVTVSRAVKAYEEG